MTDIVFKWDTTYHCWKKEGIKCLHNIFNVYIHKYPENQYLVSIGQEGYINVHHTIFDSMVAVQFFIKSKYNGIVKFRDPNEEEHIERIKTVS